MPKRYIALQISDNEGWGGVLAQYNAEKIEVVIFYSKGQAISLLEQVSEIDNVGNPIYRTEMIESIRQTDGPEESDKPTLLLTGWEAEVLCQAMVESSFLMQLVRFSMQHPVPGFIVCCVPDTRLDGGAVVGLWDGTYRVFLCRSKEQALQLLQQYPTFKSGDYARRIRRSKIRPRGDKPRIELEGPAAELLCISFIVQHKFRTSILTQAVSSMQRSQDKQGLH